MSHLGPSGCAAVLVSFLLPHDAFATECIGPQVRLLPVEDPQVIPVGATLWVKVDDVGVDFSQRECRFVAPEGEDVDAELVVHPEDWRGADSAGDGCAVSGYRFTNIGELVPQQPLAAGVGYTIVCGSGDDEVTWLRTWLATDEQPPTFEDLQLEVTDVRAFKSDCDKDRYLRLTFEPIDDRFFESKGLLLVEYDPQRLDVIRGVEQQASSSIAIVDLPLPEHTELTIRAINGLGVELGAWTVDVTGLGEEGEGGCRSSGAPPGGSSLAFFVVLACKRRKPRSSC